MDFELTDEQELIREAVREFAESELAPSRPRSTVITAFPARSSRRWRP